MHLGYTIPVAPVYWVYISQLIGYAGRYSLYADILQYRRFLSTKLFNHVFLKDRHILSCKKLVGRYQYLVKNVFCHFLTVNESWYLVQSYLLFHNYVFR